MRKMRIKNSKTIFLIIAIGLSTVFVAQPQVLNSVGSTIANIFNFNNNTKSGVSTDTPGLGVYNYPGFHQNTPVFDQALQQQLFQVSGAQLDGGLNLNTQKTVTIPIGEYFDLESGTASTTNFTAADFYLSTNNSCPVVPQYSSAALNLGVLPLDSMDYANYGNVAYPSRPCYPSGNTVALLWNTTEGNHFRTEMQFNTGSVTLTYDYLYYISINGNADLLQKAAYYGWSGDGTIANPLLISNYTLGISGIGGFSISNTDLYVIIQNSNLDGVIGLSAGIALTNVTNIDLRNNIIQDYSRGAQIENLSSSITIESNTFQSNLLEGVFLYNSSSIASYTNTITNNQGSGFLAYLSTTLTVSGNTFNSNGQLYSVNPNDITAEITLVESNGFFTGNTIENGSGYGVFILGSPTGGLTTDYISVDTNYEITFTKNQILSNTLDGLACVSSDSINLLSNEIRGNYGAGVTVSSSVNVGITSNFIEYNVKNGIAWLHSWSGVISKNDVVFNSNLALAYAKVGALNLLSSYNGIFMDPSYYNVVDQNTLSYNGNGVYLKDSGYNNFTTNYVYSNALNGFAIVNASSNLVSNNNITLNSNPYTSYNMSLYMKPGSFNLLSSYNGIFLDPSSNNVITNNEVNNNYGNGIQVEDSNNNTLSFNSFTSNANDGALIVNSSYNAISGNDISQNSNMALQSEFYSVLKPGSLNLLSSYNGIFLDPSSFNYVANNTFDSNAGNGVYISYSDNNIIGMNTITNNALNGLFVEESSSNQIAYNDISGNSNATGLAYIQNYNKIGSLDLLSSYNGIFLDPSTNNSIYGNIVSGNYGNGTLIQGSNYNSFSQNNFTGNAQNGMSVVNSNYNSISENIISANSNPILQMALNNVLNANKPGSLNLLSSYNGIFLDPSVGNNVTGNIITDNPVYGVWLQASSQNTFNGNTISNSGAHGFFVDNSNNNVIESNDIYGNGNGTLLSTFLTNSKPGTLTLLSSYSGIFLDPSTGNVIQNNNIHDNIGYGFSSNNSDSNSILSNKISFNSLEGLNFVNSNSFTIKLNSIVSNGLYGTFFDATSSGSTLTQNDFIDNGASTSSQAYDDGGNTFNANFYSNEIPGQPYVIAGSAGTTDTNVSPTPNTNLQGFNLPAVQVDVYFNSRILNPHDYERRLIAWIHFPDGYSSYLVNKSSINLEWNGNTYSADHVHTFGAHWLFVTFNLRDLNKDLLNYLQINSLSSTTITLTINGDFNGNYQQFTGSNSVRVINGEHHEFHRNRHYIGLNTI